MGRAIVRDADAFLFDEPLSNLDAKLRGQMRTEISRLQKRLGITTVYVTHDQTEAMTLGDRVAVLKRGVLQQLATPRELYTNPGNLFVAGFIGSPPMNFLPAEVDGTTVKLPFGTVEIPRETGRAGPGQGAPHRGHPARALRGRLGQGRCRRGLDVPGHRGRRRVARQRVLRLHPVRGPAGGPEAAHPAGEGPRRRPDAHSARRVPRRRQPIAEGDEAEIWVDATKIHLFDPATGENLTVDESRAGRIPEREDPKAMAQAEKMADQGEEIHSAEEV